VEVAGVRIANHITLAISLSTIESNRLPTIRLFSLQWQH